MTEKQVCLKLEILSVKVADEVDKHTGPDNQRGLGAAIRARGDLSQVIV